MDIRRTFQALAVAVSAVVITALLGDLSSITDFLKSALSRNNPSSYWQAFYVILAGMVTGLLWNKSHETRLQFWVLMGSILGVVSGLLAVLISDVDSWTSGLVLKGGVVEYCFLLLIVQIFPLCSWLYGISATVISRFLWVYLHNKTGRMPGN